MNVYKITLIFVRIYVYEKVVNEAFLCLVSFCLYDCGR